MKTPSVSGPDSSFEHLKHVTNSVTDLTTWINPEVKNFYDYDNSRELKDIKVKEYKHMGKIKFPITQ